MSFDGWPRIFFALTVCISRILFESPFVSSDQRYEKHLDTRYLLPSWPLAILIPVKFHRRSARIDICPAHHLLRINLVVVLIYTDRVLYWRFSDNWLTYLKQKFILYCVPQLLFILKKLAYLECIFCNSVDVLLLCFPAYLLHPPL